MMEGECKKSIVEEKKKETGLPEVTKLDTEEGELTDESAEEATGGTLVHLPDIPVRTPSEMP